VYLGSKPSARGKGYAKKLIEHMTEQVRPEVCFKVGCWETNVC
jgi:GNAT superfamily N-acetyltransferase